MSSKLLLKNFLLALDRCGLSPVNRSTRSQVQAWTSFVLLSHITIEQLLYVVFKWNDWEAVDSFIGLSSVIQMAYKIAFLHLKAKKLESLLVKVETFEAFENLAPNIQREFDKMCGVVLKVMKAFLVICLACVCTYSIRPLFIPFKVLPIDTYHPMDYNNSPYYEIMYFMEIIDFTLGCYCVFGFDGLFISIILHIICEFEVLKQDFLNIEIDTNTRTEESTLMKVGRLVHHHNFIIDCIRCLENEYSFFLLSQFFFSVVCICCGLLSMVVSGFPPDLGHFLKYATFLGAAMSQLFIYCVVGEYLSAQSVSVSDAVYASDWWVKTQPKLRRCCVIIIQRSNRPAKITAGGMIELNSQNFTKMLHICFSFFTMAQALYTRLQGEG